MRTKALRERNSPFYSGWVIAGIGILLVMLLFFVATPFGKTPVLLPAARFLDAGAVAGIEFVFDGAEPARQSDLRQRFRRHVTSTPPANIVLHMDRLVPWRELATVLRAAVEAEAPRVFLRLSSGYLAVRLLQVPGGAPDGLLDETETVLRTTLTGDPAELRATLRALPARPRLHLAFESLVNVQSVVSVLECYADGSSTVHVARIGAP